MSQEIFDYLAQVADHHPISNILEVIGEFICDRDLQDELKLHLEGNLEQPSAS